MSVEKTILVPLCAQGERLDKFLTKVLPDLSRARIQQAIESGEVQCNADKATQKYKLKGNEEIHIDLRESPVLSDQAEDLPIRIVYEDEWLLILNKQAGLTVHPGAGQASGTLVNALLHYDPKLSLLPRAGIVHRLDKDTTGLMVVAKTEKVRHKLIEALKEHAVERCYIAVVQGELISGLKINAPIGRHPVDRKKMAVLENSATAKPAVTHVRVLKKYVGFTLVEARLETGRTHQIRVHLAHLGYPLVGDRVYNRHLKLAFPRQALQAVKLMFQHPQTAEPMTFAIEPEYDIVQLLEVLKNKP